MRLQGVKDRPDFFHLFSTAPKYEMGIWGGDGEEQVMGVDGKHDMLHLHYPGYIVWF